MYATTIDGKTVPPTLSNTAGDGAVLLPVTGNNGVSLSGLAEPGQRTRPSEWEWMGFIIAGAAVIVVSVVICLLLDGLRRLARGRRTPVS